MKHLMPLLPLELRQAMKKHNIDENKFIIPEIGEFFLFDKNDL